MRILFLLTLGSVVFATNSTWQGGNNVWSNAGSWDNGVPNGASDEAQFLSATTTASTVTLDESITLGHVVINVTQNLALVPSSNQTITFNNGGSDSTLIVSGSAGAISITPNISIAGNNHLTLNGAFNDITLSGNLSGSGTFTIINPGPIVTLSGDNSSLTGGIDLIQGLIFFSNNSLGTGTLTTHGNNISEIRPSTSTTASNALVMNDSNLTIDVPTSRTLTLSGPLSGGAQLIKISSGTLTLSGTNSWTGGTDIQGGTLSVSSDSNIGTGTIIFDNSTGLAITGSMTLSKPISVSNTLTIAASSGATLTLNLSNAITGNGLNFSGPGSFVFTPAVTSSWGDYTTIYGSATFEFSDSRQLPANNFRMYGCTVQIPVSSSVSLPSAVLNFGAGATSYFNIPSGSHLTWNNNTGRDALTMDSTSNQMVKIGSGTLTFGGTQSYSHDYSQLIGTVVINDGAIQTYDSTMFNNCRGLQFATAGTYSSTISTLQVTHDGLTIPAAHGTYSACNVTIGSTFTAVFQIDSTYTTTINSLITGNGGLTKTGTGTLTLGGSSSYLGSTTISTGMILAGGTNVLSNASAFIVNGSLSMGLFSGTIGSLAGTGSVSMGTNSVLTMGNDGSSTTFSGSITGQGGLVKIGSGTFTMSGSSSYAGSTTITTGTFEAGHENALSGSSAFIVNSNLVMGTYSGTIGSLAGSGSVSMGTASVLTFGSAGSTTFSGSISGVGGMTKIGATTFTMAGSADYSGTTTITAGGIAVASTDALSSNSAFIVNGSLTMGTFSGTIGSLAGSGSVSMGSGSVLSIGNDNTSTTFSGSLTGAGALTKIGSGTFTQSGSASYFGTTTIADGTFAAGTNNALSDSSPHIVDGTLAMGTFSGTVASLAGTGTVTQGGGSVFSFGADNTDTTFYGNFSGTGSVVKTGSGKFTMAGSLTTMDQLTISSGEVSLGVLGHITAATVTNNGTLSGNGTIVGNVIDNGTFAPGNSIGTITIHNGTYTKNGGTYTNDISADPAPNNTDFLHVIGGNVEITAPTTFYVNVEPGRYPTFDSFVVMTVDSPYGYSGLDRLSMTFSSPVIDAQLLLEGQDLVLEIQARNLTSIVTNNRNAKAVAVALDKIFTSDNTAMNDVFIDFSGLSTDAELEAALNVMQPALFKGASVAQEYNGMMVRGAIDARMEPLYDQIHYSSSKNREIALFAHNSDELVLDDTCKTENKPFSAWATGVGDFFHQGAVQFQGSPQFGYSNQMGGVITGLDYNYEGHLYAGALGAYTHSHLNWSQSQGKANVDSGYAGIYGSAIYQPFYCNLSAIGGWSNFDETRNIIFPGVFQTAKNSHHGEQFIAHGDLGLFVALEYKGFTLRPFESFDYLFARESGFTENGAGEYDLTVKSTRMNMLRNELGLNLASCYCNNNKKFIADGKLSWVREMRLNGSSFQPTFVAVPTVPFIVTGTFVDRSLLSAGANLSLLAYDGNLAFTLYYNGLFGPAFQENGFGGQLRCSF